MLPVGTILRGIYRIDSYLSSGGFGNTYVATNIEFDERVAIKEFFMKGVTQRDDNQTTVSVSNSENVDSFQQQKEKFKKEARRLRRLKNEHIVKVYDLFEENGTAYYVMDYIDGENLSERLKRTGKPMTEEEVHQLLPQILDALKTVHDEKFCHLDLKPSNIMVDKAGNVKLIDFGASKQMGADGLLTTTVPTAFAQTPGYAPREQMEQYYEKIGPWTDIYALGATLYALLSNKKPPLPSDIEDDMSADKHLALPLPDSVSNEMKALVLMMLQPNRAFRPQNVSSLIEAEKARKDVQNGGNCPNPDMPNGKNDDGVDEGTIGIGEQPKERVGQNPEQPTPTPKPTDPPSDEEKGKKTNKGGWGWFFVLLLIGAIGYGCYLVSTKVNSKEDVVTVNKMNYKTGIGSCKYTGPVDEDNKPHGLGEAVFNDGRYYKGEFEHGVLTGDNAYFKYSNGDVFEGRFYRNSFFEGKYTIAEDGSYYIGYYSNGQPDGGTWYDKNGKKIE